MRQIEIESGFDNGAVSADGALGIAQLLPTTAAQPGFGVAPCGDPTDPVEATEFLCDYMAALKRLKGGWGLALLAYNVGPEAPPETASHAYKCLGLAAALAYGEEFLPGLSMPFFGA